MSRRPHSPQPSSSSGGGARRRHHNNPWMNGRGRGAGTGGGGGGAAAFPEPSSSSGFAFRPGHSVNEEDDLDDPLIDSTVDSMGRPSYFQQVKEIIYPVNRNFLDFFLNDYSSLNIQQYQILRPFLEFSASKT